MTRGGARDGAIAVIPAGGIGARMGSRRPKQYLSVAGLPLLVRTLRALRSCRGLEGVVVAAPADRIVATRSLLARYRVESVDVVAGGSSRQESVWRGLQAIPPSAQWVVVHDGVRPFVTGDLVTCVLAAARRWGAATCGIPVRETVKRVSEGMVQATVDRDGLWLIQTPQAFRRDLLWEAHERARRDGFTGTDDAVLVERLGSPVAMVGGLPHNVKITTPEDLSAARLWLGRRSPTGS
jgi:2-C-methyl-D-erythritol 4-phosphate cytidylyltransferase